MANGLSPAMTVREFENGYWYLDQLKNFAERIGIPPAKKLRKDELEGPSYRLNRWREEQVASGERPTYGDLVRQYIGLNKMDRFERVPHGRYINFIADFLKVDKRATRAEAIAAWTELKELDVPKDSVSWVNARAKRNSKNK